MAKKPATPDPTPKLSSEKPGDGRYFWSGVVFALFTMVVLSALIWMSMNGKSIADQDRAYPIFFLAMGAGLSLGAFGGSATAGGQFKLGPLDTPLKFAVTGGIAVFFLVLFTAPYVLPSSPTASLALTQVTGIVLEKAPKPDRVLITADFARFEPQANRRLVLNVGDGADCAQVKSSATVDQPNLGKYKLFVLTTQATITCAQLTLQDANNNRVGASKVVPVQWQ
ncbi:MAG TPA: hypothetical protein VFV98_10960 [Vicinamibacterales bacterium]|nr:hypothetical protein [Vicinamibacterales bacterium]